MSNLSRLLCFVCAGGLAAFAVGCNRQGYSLAEVRGVVVDAGKPQGGLSVVFQPIAPSADNPNPGPASSGITDEKGEFSLHTIDNDRLGAVVGKHRARIHVHKRTLQSDGDRSDPDAAIPLPFRDGSLIIEVPADGLTSQKFDLASPTATP